MDIEHLLEELFKAAEDEWSVTNQGNVYVINASPKNENTKLTASKFAHPHNICLK